MKIFSGIVCIHLENKIALPKDLVMIFCIITKSVMHGKAVQAWFSNLYFHFLLQHNFLLERDFGVLCEYALNQE